MGCLLAPLTAMGWLLVAGWYLLMAAGWCLVLLFRVGVLGMEAASLLVAMTVAGVAAARAPAPAPIPAPRPRPRMPQNGRWSPQERPQAPVMGQGLVRGGTAMLTTRRSPAP